MAHLTKESRVYTLRGTTEILGGLAASREIRTQYIASKAPTPELMEEEAALGPDIEEKGLTIFPRDAQDNLCLMDRHIKGFFKEALTALKPQLGIAAPNGKVDTLVFVEPRYIPIRRDGEKLRDEDSVNERPLRANTMQGPRVSLAASEQIDTPWEVTFEITLFPSAATAKSKALTWDAIEAALEYGELHGLGQWRNAGYGRFVYERTEDENE